MIPSGLDSLPAGSRVVVAMSGGVDSSVTAALLAEAGYDVVGITLQLYDHGAAVGRPGSCCAGQDIQDARRVAERLGIPHYVLDYEDRFRRDVIDAFADAYVQGETPIPCVACNRTVKFRDLTQVARDLGAAALATGHYARRIDGADGPELRQGADPARDQSYFLFATTPDQLAFLRFPLGAMTKAETRGLAQRFGLSVAAKADSQDICFVPNGGYAELVGRLRPQAAEPGEIVDVTGRVLGTHPGIIHFTVGQRRGLGLSDHEAGGGEPLYVLRLQPTRRRVVVGPRAALGVERVGLREVNWLGAGDGPPAEGLVVRVKVRSTTPPVPARVRTTPKGDTLVTFGTPQAGVAPGQACVFYDGDRLLGGGWIVREACPPPIP